MTDKAAPPPRPGPRGLAPATLLAAAIALRESAGEAGFSVRKLAAHLGCDPMAVLYHFGSKEGLERAMADALSAEIVVRDPPLPWRACLEDMAHQYRALALRRPQTFPLLMRFWTAGPADYRLAEVCYNALREAGLPDPDVVDCCFGWYASMLGLAMGEIGGLLQPASPTHLAEVRQLPANRFPVTTQLLPVFAAQQAGQVFVRTVTLLLDGIERRRDEARPPRSVRG